ncbi:hypothetical protein LCGC14_2480250 [marine sediment metagenome]|uniref:Uncharacterized protein n=1 Tax=marine sediment metagenome TaxID=412755 RepID=A0A0F9B8K9_9ZZZZ
MPRDPYERKYDPVMFKAFDALRKVAKTTWKAMGSTLKEIKASTSLLAAFGSQSLIAKVFDKVITNWGSYLSNTLWGEVVSGIDFTIMTTVITDILGPIFAGVGGWIGDRIEEAPIGTSLGASIGALIGSFAGNAAIGAVIGGAIGYSIEQAPMGAALGTLIGAALGNVIGGPFGTLIVTPIGTALGALIESIIIDITESDAYKAAFGILPEEDISRLGKLKEYMDMGFEITSDTFLDYLIDLEKKSGLIALLGLLGAFPPPGAGGYYPGAGGLPPGYQQFQFGTPFVQRTGPAIVHRGEEIIPANRRGRGEITINIDLRNAVVDNVDRLSQRIAEMVWMKIG